MPIYVYIGNDGCDFEHEYCSWIAIQLTIIWIVNRPLRMFPLAIHIHMSSQACDFPNSRESSHKINSGY